MPYGASKKKIYTGSNSNGSIQFKLTIKDGYRKAFTVHRAVWLYVNGPIKDENAVIHRDGNLKNNSINNLQLLSEASLLNT